MINWDTSIKEDRVINQITNRVLKRLRSADKMKTMMDISACHCNGCKLDLKGLRDADDMDFWHDIIGISKNINRQTGEIENCFVPRFAKGENKRR